MMDIVNNYLVQLGSLGIIIIGLIYFSRYMFVYLMKQMKEQANENKVLEKDFREYLLNNSKEHHLIIEKNTDVYEKLVELISIQMTLIQNHDTYKN